MATLIRSLFLLLTIVPFVSWAQEEATTPLVLGQYQLSLPTNNIATYGLLKNTLSARYSDGGLVTISIVPRAEFNGPETQTAVDFLRDAFGNHATEENDDFTIFKLVAGERRSAYIGDPNQPDYFVSIYTQNRPLEPLLESFTRR